MVRSRLFLLPLILSLPTAVSSHAFVSEKTLSPRFQHWLNVEVPYIIESEERSGFLALHTDAERDNFIQQFWESRNPNPGTGTNARRDEHYRRLAYANEHFGDAKNANGWRTDQGRIYITLGEPQSRVTYPNARNVRPMIAWFYQQPSPALPSFFYVVFYKRSIGDPYTLYSPYQDGPNRLVTGLEDMNDQKRSLQTLRKSLGDEVARLSLTLLPSEPANLNEYSPSMSSDAMLATIKGLPDNYLEKLTIANNRRREKVTASIVSTEDQPSVSYAVSRDERGGSTVHYLVQFAEPKPSIVGERKNKTLGYDLTLQSHVTTTAGKPVYDEVDVLTGGLGAGQADVARKKAFAAEERFPLAPGSYVIQSTLTNNLDLEAHRFTESVVVPAPRPSGLALSEPVVYSGNPVQAEGNQLPFSFSSFRFSPRAIHTVTVHPGDRIPCVFQLWLPKSKDGAPDRAPVLMHYLLGSASATGKPLDESEETLDLANADPAGNFTTGHTFQTGPLAPGSYRLVIRATQAGSPPAFSTMTVHVVPSDTPIGVWSAYGPPEPAQDDSKRALSAKAQGLP